MPLKKKRGPKRSKPSAAYTKDAKVRTQKARFNLYDTTCRQRKKDNTTSQQRKKDATEQRFQARTKRQEKMSVWGQLHRPEEFFIDAPWHNCVRIKIPG